MSEIVISLFWMMDVESLSAGWRKPILFVEKRMRGVFGSCDVALKFVLRV